MPKSIYTNNTVLIQDKKFTFVSTDVVAGATTLGIQSTIGFQSLTTSSGQIIMIGELGQEKTEIIKTSSTTAPSGTSITLNSALRFDHPQDTKVFIIDWDRFEIQWSASATGTKSTIATYPFNLQADQLESQYRDTTQTTGFYFVRFNETIGNTNSDWSDPIPYGGYDDNSVFSIKKRALDAIGESIDGEVITNDMLNSWLWEARREYHQAAGKRPFRRKFNFVMPSAALTGSYRIELPTDVEKPHTSENIYGVRIGTNQNMAYVDKKEWDFYYINRPHSTLDVPYTKNTSTSIWLANGRDFSASATINVEGTNIGLSRITGSQNSFTIVTHGSWSASGGSDVWENASFGLPNLFTVFADPGGSAYIYFNRPIDTAYVNQNIYADYYRTLVGFDSDADILDEPNYDMYVDYLKAKIKHRRSRGTLDITQDPDYKLWASKRDKALASENVETDVRFIPNIPDTTP